MILVSMVAKAIATATKDARAARIIERIRLGKWRRKVENIRGTYQRVLKDTGDLKKAKTAIVPEKKKLPGVLWSGTFRNREKPTDTKLLTHSGLLCADLDALGDRLAEVKAKLAGSPHLWALFLSPSGDGIKAIFCVARDRDKHNAGYRAVAKHVLDLTGEKIDGACKDLARLCFVSYDPEAFLNTEATELPPLAVKLNAALPIKIVATAPGIETRQRIATELLGTIEWESETRGFCICPGKSSHTAAEDARDCQINLDGTPTIFCFHNSCSQALEAKNRELRSILGKPDQMTAATRLIEIAKEFAFFHDSQQRTFVRLAVKGHDEVWPVNSTSFRNLLAQTFYRRTGKAINRNALGDAIATLAGRACYDGAEEPVFLRVAPYGEGILIDLCDAQWRVIEVKPGGWRILEKSPVAFLRTGAMQALPSPASASEGSLEPLWDLLNVTPAQRPLVAGALLNFFHPHGPYFVLNLVGEQGTAKSCCGTIVRRCVDPNVNPLRSPPREERDLLVQAGNNWCVVLDNLSALPQWLSDGLCRLSTGGGHSARQLYSDGEEFSLSVKRPVILTGIDDVATRPDLTERALQIELEVIPDNRRMTEKALWQKLESVGPIIFAAMLNGLSCALRELPNVKMDSLPRMADAALWATAGETAFGWAPGAFMAAYRLNLSNGAIASLDAHPVGSAIRQFLETQNSWKGEASQLLEELNALVMDSTRQNPNWPKNARSLSASLRRLAQAFRRAGFEADFGKGKRRSIQLSKRSNLAPVASPVSPDLTSSGLGDAKRRKFSTFALMPRT